MVRADLILLICFGQFSVTHSFIYSTCSRHRLSSSLTKTSLQESRKKSFTLTVSHQGQTCQIPIEEDESILNALERARIAEKFSLSETPSDCRRGNCLTCSAKVLRKQQNQRPSLHLQADGLSPSLSQLLAEKDYVLTCSSYIRGDGVHLELEENHNAWKFMYQERLQSPEMEVTTLAAMAKVIRKHAERNQQEWTRETEQVLQKSRGSESLLADDNTLI